MKEVSTQEFIQMATRCSQEIKDLRATIDRQRPKADAYDAICTILGLLPRSGVSMSEDLAWRLDQRIRELTAKDDPAPTEGPITCDP